MTSPTFYHFSVHSVICFSTAGVDCPANSRTAASEIFAGQKKEG